MKRYLYTLMSIALVACSEASDETPQLNIGEGRVAISTSITNFVAQSETRSAASFEIPAELLPTSDELAQFELRITGTYYSAGDRELTSFDQTYESIEAYNVADVDKDDPTKLTPPYLPAGDYTATITDNRDRTAEGEGTEFGCFGGEMEFTVAARDYNSEQTITAALENSMVRLQVTESYARYFTESTLVISTEDGKTFSVDFPLATDVAERLFFVKADTNLYLSGSATKQDPGNGSPSTVTYTKTKLSGVATAGELTTVVVDAQSAGFFTVTVNINNEITKIHEQEIDLNDSVD